MKHSDYKLIAFVNEEKKIATLAAKKKNGLLITLSDTNIYGNSVNFTAFLGSSFVQIWFKKKEKWIVTIKFIGKDIPTLFFACKTKKQFKKFINSDYHNFPLTIKK